MFTTKVYNLITLCYALYEQSTCLSSPSCLKPSSLLEIKLSCLSLKIFPFSPQKFFYRDLNENLFVLVFYQLRMNFFLCMLCSMSRDFHKIRFIVRSNLNYFFFHLQTQAPYKKVDKRFPLLNKAN